MGSALVAFVEAFGPWVLVVAGLAAAVWLYATDRLVSRGRYRDLSADRDFWRGIATGALDVAEHAAKEVGRDTEGDR